MQLSAISKASFLNSFSSPTLSKKQSKLPLLDLEFDSFTKRSSYALSTNWDVISVPKPSRANQKSTYSPSLLQRLQNPTKGSITQKEVEDFLDEIAQGRFQQKASLKELRQALHLLIRYAKEGTEDPLDLPHLEKDTHELLALEKGFDFVGSSFSSSKIKAHEFLCSKKKSWFQKVCKKVGNFVKKHRKAIVLGICIAAAVAVVAVAAVAAINTVGTAALAEGAAASAAAAAGVMGNASTSQESLISEEDSPEILEEAVAQSDINDSLLMKEASHSYEREIAFLEKAIEFDPLHPMQDLDIYAADLGLLADKDFSNQFNQYLPESYTSYAEPAKEFRHGFSLGLTQGAQESGSNLGHLGQSFLQHPVHTLDQTMNALRDLSNLVLTDQWSELAEVLSPEAYQLATEWEYLSNYQRGQLAGHAIGKLGTDIFIPAAGAKVVSKGVRGAEKLLEISETLQKANQVLIQELAAQEIVQIKQAGQLETAVDQVCANLINKTPSEAYIAAKNGGKHAPLITEFGEKSVKEIQKSIRSYEKLVVEHKDKIANPSKYCPDWDNMDPRHKNSLVEVKWPAEIQCYTEQRDILQSMLDLKQ